MQNFYTKFNMKTYKYETHLHTSEASKCGSSEGAEYISVYKKLGYAGIFVTDHFFGGNTAVSHELDWHTRIEQYCKGYENALAEAKNKMQQTAAILRFSLELNRLSKATII